ncbi:MAG: HAMP domain-containing protein [Planctomycetes bacterium]|nr:HAMP domain-containing protein [Planctomycetota bacterium]
MSLRSKILLALATVVVAFAAADFWILRRIFDSSFHDLERTVVERDLLRVQESIRREVEGLQQFCNDWGGWDELYAFAADRNSAFVASNFSQSTLGGNNLDVVYVSDVHGNVLYRNIVDPRTGSSLHLPEFPSGRVPQDHSYYSAQTHDSQIPGILPTAAGPLLLASSPILTGAGQGPSRGLLTIGRFLTNAAIERLRLQTRVDFRIWQLNGTGSSIDEVSHALPLVHRAGRAYTEVIDEDHLFVYGLLEDYTGAPGFLLRASLGREITKRGSEAVQFALYSTVCAGALVLGALVLILQRSVLSPLARLSEHAQRVGERDDYLARLDNGARDEIGVLSREFDRMLGKLAAARTAAADAARAAGKSELATSVLHNIGNVLNSVNVSTQLAVEQVHSMRVEDLEKLAEVLGAQADLLDAEIAVKRCRAARRAVAALSEHFRGRRASAEQELSALAEGIVHIRELVRAQQSDAGHVDLIEVASLSDIIERAIRITESAEGAAPGVWIERDLEQLPPMALDRQRLTEVLVNLLQNARQALAPPSCRERKICISLRRISADRVRIGVRDTGVGIAPENLPKMFQLGFTTKARGHGVGLHASANVIHRLGGAIRAESAGIGHGAEFIVDFPAYTPEPKAAKL